VTFRSARTWQVVGAVALAAVLAQQFWHWVVERVEVPPGQFLVRVALWGKPLPAGEVLAPDESYQGIQKDVMPEGRHFLNPLVWAHEVHPMIEVPAGQCAVLTRRYGKDLPADRVARGELLVDLEPRPGDEEYRGVVRQVLLPGRHRVNPHAYDHKLVPAVEVKAEQVGVRTVKVGLDPRVLKLEPDQSQYVVPVGRPEGDYRGVQEKPLAAGTYYVNPYAEAIIPVDVRSHRVEFTDIEFPSRDGFTLKPQVLVTYRVDPAKAPELFVTLTEQGKLEQGDDPHDINQNQILQKVVLPNIRGYARIEGSKFDARDFIAAANRGSEAAPAAPATGPAVNPRERLQQFLMEKVSPHTRRAGVIIESVTLAAMDVPPDLAQQIADRELARVVREKNQDRIGQYKTEQELKATEALKQQQQDVVDARTRLVTAGTLAEQRKAVEESNLKQQFENARVRLEAAKKQAEAQLATGKAEADVIRLKNEAEVSGLRQAVQGFPTADLYAQYQVLQRLAPALTEIFASDGSDFAKLFSNYLTPPAATAEKDKTAAGKPAAQPAEAAKKSGE
jgi:regulator of protease activity HflC (stomatin/prohibitin superfamily)